MVAEEQEALLTADAPEDSAADSAVSELDRLRRANRRYMERYRAAARIMSVIEEVSRYDEQVNTARINRQKHFAERAERSIRRMQSEGVRLNKEWHALGEIAGSALARLGTTLAGHRVRTELPPNLPKEQRKDYDFAHEFDWAQQMQRTGFVFWDDANRTDTAEGLMLENWLSRTRS